jgi:hypothetical protein
MSCKLCGADDSDSTTIDLQDLECGIFGPNSSPCNLCEELANLETLITRLGTKRFELKRNRNRTHSPFIRMIPPEIIARISGFTSTNFTIIGSLPAPILLSSVCRDWRQTVIGTPRLWTSIRINLPSISETSKMRACALSSLATFIDKWLARSGQLPLRISLTSANQTPGSQTVEMCRPIFQVIHPGGVLSLSLFLRHSCPVFKFNQTVFRFWNNSESIFVVIPRVFLQKTS